MANEVFISYSRKDIAAVKEIKKYIDNAVGIDCWFDIDGIESGEQFEDVIINAICKHDTILFMKSSQSMQSEWALDELDFAKRKNKRIVLVHIDDSEMTDKFYFRYHKYDQIVWKDPVQRNKLIRDLRKWSPIVSHTNNQPENEAKRKEEEKHQKKLKALESTILRPIIKDGKWGFADDSGKLVIPCQWKYASSFSYGLAPVEDDNEKYGFIDKTGKVVIPCRWGWAEKFSNDLARVQDNNGKYGFIDKMGRLVIPCEWKDALPFSEGLAHVKDNNDKWGFIDKTGKLVIPCKWKLAYKFREGLAKVQDENLKYGLIDKTGKVVIPCQWMDARYSSNGLAEVMDEHWWWWKIDKTGKIVKRV